MVTVLDKPEWVKKVDKSNMLSDLVKTPDYCRDAIKRTKKVNVTENVNAKNVVIVSTCFFETTCSNWKALWGL